MGVQFIKAEDGTELAVLPREEYEDLVDTQAGQDVADALAAGTEELLTSEELQSFLSASTPLLFWREKRGLARDSLAARLDLSDDALAEIEAGRADAPLAVYRRAAESLGVSLDDLAA